MIPQNLTDYIRVYKNHIEPELCHKVIEGLKGAPWETHTYHDPGTDKFISYEHELSVTYSGTPEAREVQDRVWYALQRYVTVDFASFNAWLGGWSGYTPIRFNKYDPTTRMKIHCDHIQTIFDGERKGIPTLTVLGALNDDYEGGEFFMFGDQQIHLPTGSVIVFPSNFMYPHEVKPVKSGVRYSYVSWAW